MIPKQHRAKATWAAACVACVAGFEGLRQHAYSDPVGIPTICFGETKGVHLGDVKTVEECNAMLEGRLYEFADAVASCVTAPVPDPTMSAYVSLAYNIGGKAFCGSSVVRLWNGGQKRASCDAMLKWNRAGGVVFPGLTRRREAERALCLQGLA